MWSEIGMANVVARRAAVEDRLTEDFSPAWCRIATDLDDRLGLTPKGLAQLRWSIAPWRNEAADAADDMPPVTPIRDRVRVIG